MLDFTESIDIDAPRDRVWEVLRDIDRWWPQSNPEHVSLQHLDDRPPTEVGARLRVEERIGGIPGEAVGAITAVEPHTAVTWEADARYRWLGIPIRLTEGVTWRVRSDEAATTVSAHVWASRPHGVFGGLAAFLFVHVLSGEAKDREHTRTELRHLKRLLEQGA